jgi:hypothetical protein
MRDYRDDLITSSCTNTDIDDPPNRYTSPSPDEQAECHILAKEYIFQILLNITVSCAWLKHMDMEALWSPKSIQKLEH